MSDLVDLPRRVLDDFLRRVEAVSERSGLSEATLSTRIFNDGSKIKDLKAGKDVGVLRLTKVMPNLRRLEAAFPPPEFTAAVDVAGDRVEIDVPWPPEASETRAASPGHTAEGP